MSKMMFVDCVNHNGHKHVKLVLRLTDFKPHDKKSGYTPIAIVDVTENRFEHTGVAYQIHFDHTVSVV